MGGSCHLTSQAGFDWNQWVGLPFESLGTGSHNFFCWHLVRAILREAKGVDLPSLEECQGTPLEKQTGKMIADHYGTYGFMPVPLNEAQPFDVIVFRVGSTQSHVGVVVSRGKFLHGGRNLDSCIERYTDMNWKNRVQQVYRYHP